MQITSVDDFAQSTPVTANSIQFAFPVAALAPQQRHARGPVKDGEQFALAQLAQWFVDREPQPHLIVDAAMTVLLMNEAAKHFLAGTRVLTLHANKLAFGSERHRDELHRLLDEAQAQVFFTTRTARSSASICIRWLPRWYGTGKLLLITICAAASLDCERLRTELGLTKAESEIALAIFKGASLVRIAMQRGASINTVKTQARCIFQKCRVHSQVGLTRRIGELLPASSRHA